MNRTKPCRLFLTNLGLLLLTTLAACTPEGEVDLQQVAEAFETAEAVSVGATAQAVELASLRATMDAPTALPLAIHTTEPSPAVQVTPTATVVPNIDASVLREPTSLPTPTMIPTTTPSPVSSPSPSATPVQTSTSTPPPTVDVMDQLDQDSRYSNAEYGYAFDIPNGWLLTKHSDEYVDISDPTSNSLISVQIDPSTIDFVNGDVWQTFWWLTGTFWLESASYQLVQYNELAVDKDWLGWNYVEEFEHIGSNTKSKGAEQFYYSDGLGVRIYEESSLDDWDREIPVFQAFLDSFVMPDSRSSAPHPTNPKVCEQINEDTWYSGTLFNTSVSQTASMQVQLIQIDCSLVGSMLLYETDLVGSGTFHGELDGQAIRFRLPASTNEANMLLTFTGNYDADSLSGVYVVESSGESGTWSLTPDKGRVFGVEPTPIPTPSATPTPTPPTVPTVTPSPTQVPIVIPPISDVGIITTCINGTFDGWSGGTVFELCNGQIWEQTDFGIHIAIKINPAVTIIESGGYGTMTIDSSGKSVQVQEVTNFMKSCIDGMFEGWSGDTIFELCNGQTWQQTSYNYKYSYKYGPLVLIYESVFGGIRMKVDGISETISVVRLQ